VSALAALALAPPWASAQEATYQFDLPVQPLGQALRAVGQQTRKNVLFDPALVEGRTAPALRAQLSLSEAVKRLLSGTTLGIRDLPPDTIVVTRPRSDSATTSAAPLSPAAELSPQNRPAGQEYDERSLHLAQATLSGAQSDSSVEKANGEQLPKKEAVRLEEVVVTAEKRKERLQDVPVPVTAINADTLVENNQLRLQDYSSSVPGLTVTPVSQTQQGISIRGITTAGSTTPTVGITIDDVPYGSSTLLGGGPAVPDIDPGDLAQVEVLRGPQGTLYGVASIGGLLKFVTVDPSTSAVSGRLEAGVDGVHNGAELGYNVRGSVNIPLSQDLAVRASAFTREDPGYIDNPILHIDGVNKAEAYGGRFSALWSPTDTFSVKLSALLQDSHGTGNQDVDRLPGLGDLQQNYIAEAGAYGRKFQAYSAILKDKLANFELTSITGYNINEFNYSYDETAFYGQAAQGAFQVGNALLPEHNKTNKVTQELRLSTPIGPYIDWLLGGFYTHESSKFVETVQALTDQGVNRGQLIYDSFPTTYTEYSAFTDFTLHFTDQFDLQIGGRETHIDQSYAQVLSGLLVGASPSITPERTSAANAFTYLLTPRFRISPDLMVYARLASGYRAGAPNAPLNVPRESNPDKTYNYEVGAKSDLLDHTLSIDASLYYIDWKDIQVGLFDSDSHQFYQGNAGRAKSEGAELSVQARPWRGLTASAWVAFDDAVLTQAFPPSALTAGTYGASGDRLPFSSRFSGNLALEDDFPIAGSLSGFVGGGVSYVGARKGEFTATPQRQELPAYTKTDLHGGLKYELWTANIYVNNVTDRRGLLYGGLGGFPAYAFDFIQPRTIGLSVIRTF